MAVSATIRMGSTTTAMEATTGRALPNAGAMPKWAWQKIPKNKIYLLLPNLISLQDISENVVQSGNIILNNKYHEKIIMEHDQSNRYTCCYQRDVQLLLSVRFPVSYQTDVKLGERLGINQLFWNLSHHWWLYLSCNYQQTWSLGKKTLTLS